MDTVIPAGFHGAAARLTVADIDRAAAALGIEDRLVEAVAYVEANNHGFLDDGRPQLLFEAAWFSKLTGGRWDESHPNISSPVWNSRLYGAEGAHQYERLAEAMALDPAAALQAATWGMFQELGANCSAVGFATIADFVSAMCAGEGKHLDIFVAHCVHFRLVGDLQAQDWASFARGYNGSGQVNLYAAKLEAAYKAGNFPPLPPAPAQPPPAPLPVPLPPPPRPPAAIAVELRPGMQQVFPDVSAVDQDMRPIALTSADLVSADAAVAVAQVSGPDKGLYTIAINALALGSTMITGPGVAWAVSVERSVLTRILVDVSKAIRRPIPAAVAMMAIMMFAPTSLLDRAPRPPAELTAAMAEVPARESALSPFERLCLEDKTQPSFAIKRCLKWVASLH
jgi:hypothetical protein